MNYLNITPTSVLGSNCWNLFGSWDEFSEMNLPFRPLFWEWLALEKCSTGCSRSIGSLLHNTPEDWRPKLQCSGSLESRNASLFYAFLLSDWTLTLRLAERLHYFLVRSKRITIKQLQFNNRGRITKVIFFQTSLKKSFSKNLTFCFSIFPSCLWWAQTFSFQTSPHLVSSFITGSCLDL